jgi:hypothetical protein
VIVREELSWLPNRGHHGAGIRSAKRVPRKRRDQEASLHPVFDPGCVGYDGKPLRLTYCLNWEGCAFLARKGDGVKLVGYFEDRTSSQELASTPPPVRGRELRDQADEDPPRRQAREPLQRRALKAGPELRDGGVAKEVVERRRSLQGGPMDAVESIRDRTDLVCSEAALMLKSGLEK